MFQKMKKSKGFTLIEMLVVIAIIAVLVSIIVPVVGNSTKKAKAATDAANLRSFATTIAVDYLDDSAVTDNNHTAPSAKSLTSTGVVVVDNKGNLEAYFTDGTNYYGVNQFTAVADGTNTGDLASTSLPTGATQIYPTVTTTG